MQRCKAQSQEKKHYGNLQDLRRVEDPALVYLVMRHVLQDRNEVRQPKEVENSKVPQKDGNQWANEPSDPNGGRLQPQRNDAEMLQTSYNHNRPLQRTVDLSKDLNQQTYVVSAQLQAQEDNESIRMDVNGGPDKGQSRVNDSQRNTENPHEAFADVAPLDKHQGPVEQTFPSQTEQQGGDRDVHGVLSGRVFNQKSTRNIMEILLLQEKTIFLIKVLQPLKT